MSETETNQEWTLTRDPEQRRAAYAEMPEDQRDNARIAYVQLSVPQTTFDESPITWDEWVHHLLPEEAAAVGPEVVELWHRWRTLPRTADLAKLHAVEIDARENASRGLVRSVCAFVAGLVALTAGALILGEQGSGWFFALHMFALTLFMMGTWDIGIPDDEVGWRRAD